jgi:hypothetical protein
MKKGQAAGFPPFALCGASPLGVSDCMCLSCLFKVAVPSVENKLHSFSPSRWEEVFKVLDR